jgi:hypothetical protein
VRWRSELRRWFKVARRAEFPKGEERMKGVAFAPLCFGDFHLGPQVFAQRGFAHFAQRSDANTKVTRPPGRDPALRNPTVVKRRLRATGRNAQRAG